MDPALVGAIVGACVAGLLTPIGSIVVVTVQSRQAQQDRHRAAHLAAAAEVLNALQHLNRELINVARDPSPDKADASNEFWADLHQAATRWNAARYAAALYCSQRELDLLAELDTETDELLGKAMSKEWLSRDFRPHRQQLGALAASFLREARAASGQVALQLPSLWAWDTSPPPAYLPARSQTAAPTPKVRQDGDGR